ncbi:family 10 glycosylhydrolase [Cohnella silvisoli]|uniref:Family 10 glycosylhydrolase n=1 Tax=Cohnella silvisoli TaxID=2873699 RepID=A0ABV1L2S5_9BACL|nr:family 10 glycosylhydrolase [Cohnella silvisoli]MCD9025496.1 family 10 glycosylhydrolase [Cohnella silvisoli]
MKLYTRFICVLLSLVLCVPLIGSTNTFAKTPSKISIYLDGNLITSDVPPYIIPKLNITMVPLSVISKNLGAGVTWTQATKTATITQTGLTLTMKIGQKYAMVNGERVNLDATVQAISGRVMVPLRFVSNQMKLLVTWYQSAQTIKLQSEEGLADNSLKGAWISTVFNLDWPSKGSYGNAELQQQEYVQMLDELQDMGLNTVFVQVRPSADSLYPSQLVPWSKFLQGTQGLAPDYDPLAFMIAETHRRGMEFHAWFNPFRANTDLKTENLASNHVAITNPEWIVKSGNIMYINPGIPDARQHIIDAIMEVVNNYEIDGVHLDDYFYPSGGKFDDDLTYSTYNANNISTKDDWRRDNINQFVQQLGQAIHLAKPQVQYGISPFGVWRNQSVDSTGSDTKAGVTAYDNMYADVRTWIQQDWIDYVVPQIYWSLSFQAARYDKLVDWWANEVRGTNVKLYIGHATYKLGTPEIGWSTAQEIINQLNYNKNDFEVKGDVYFSAKDLRRNPFGLIPALQDYYKVTKP